MANNEDNLMVWIDLETFGLTPDTGPVIEIGLAVSDLDLNILGAKSWTFWSDMHDAALDNTSKLVLDMHKKSGLWEDAKRTGRLITDEKFEEESYFFLNHLGVRTPKKHPLCGSSLRMDRNFLDAYYVEFHEYFSYRSIDVSSVKELCRRFNPEVYSHLEDDRRKDEAPHRVLGDIEASIRELKFYQDNFMFVTLPVTEEV